MRNCPALQKVKVTMWPGNSTWVLDLHPRMESRYSNRLLYTSVHHGMTYSGQNWKQSTHPSVDKHNVFPPHMGASLSHKKGRSPDIRYHVNGP